jgi:hypothetical protein
LIASVIVIAGESYHDGPEKSKHQSNAGVLAADVGKETQRTGLNGAALHMVGFWYFMFNKSL